MKPSQARVINIQLIGSDVKLAVTLKTFLETNGFSVEISHKAESFFAKLRSAKSQLIICEIDLPDIDGFEIFRRLSKSYEGAFIFLTARTEVEDQIKGLQMDPDDYICIPVNPKILKARIDVALNRR